ncbi:AraC family transcriptional regulator [Bacteroides faecalis]|uniref:Transcriptional regulator n=1 Tax=Bacteroides faecalis TaxID=2447885 RepID=A0A401M082_9BACE|nr:AraC family transcriptional regulator [Bacteroides faecalis]GCB37147.1 transcriptional regulator [Bacteroides faecalis]
MDKWKNDQSRYLAINATDENWGMVVTTIGCQFILPQGEYPSSHHPEQYNLKPQTGRVLNEYQLVYITQGSGYFSSQSCKKRKIYGGTMILLFPGEWHNYYPDKDTGWDEYWVGFRGSYMDQQVERGFFSKKEPLHQIRLSATVVGLYEDILKLAVQEKSGYQQIISGIVMHILGAVYYKEKNNSFSNVDVIDKINQARIIIKQTLEESLNPEDLATQLGLGYSWFRRVFKEYTGVSPVQYQLQQKMIQAKEYLNDPSSTIASIAYRLGFETVGQFSTFFRKREGVSPTKFREMLRLPENIEKE